jgi:hypothetical protein
LPIGVNLSGSNFSVARKLKLPQLNLTRRSM